MRTMSPSCLKNFSTAHYKYSTASMTPKACDRCYRNKEKCSFASSSESCIRCQYLSVECRASRTKKRKGRRPILRPLGHGTLQVWETEPGGEGGTNNVRAVTHTLDFDSRWTTVDISGNILQKRFQHVIRRPFTPQTALEAMDIVTNEDKFTTIHSPFAMGRSFMRDLRLAVYSVLHNSAPGFIDGYLAFLALVSHCQASCLPLASPDLHRGKNALQTLQSTRILRSHDALCVLLLGQALYVFEILTNSTATSAHSIVQSALISAQPWYSALSKVPDFDTITFCPVLLDMVGCLVYRKVPVIRLCGQDRIIVDRYVGLCSPLLPLLYRLCEQSHAAKSNATTPERLEDGYNDIESSIELWAPEVPAHFFTAYDNAEKRMMMIQAKVYRLAALLVIHRLRFPLGTQDDLGQSYASLIIEEIASYFAQKNTQGAGAFPVTFPLFIAMLEVEGPGEDLLENLRCFPIQHVCMLRMHDFVKHVRMMKERGFNDLWFGLVESNLTCALIP
ncbi:hypothetical protein EDB81DRAFT_814408 [Dactylonectria macrodidyma]|uniref:Zn(2)-C6 fungal-type domain-containing protein n=1 Tax=Dactylonectria macrodidyma TaxID=307937 RepID=A0A9P9DKC7_9HYPO|nr:hypothetical protein EDB81DRAFT_814408 [Dactylonectria macrodidyma]